MTEGLARKFERWGVSTVQTSVGLLTLDDRVLYDPSAHQWESGWFAFDADEKEYFIGDDGTVYNNSDEWPDVWDMEVGKVVEA